MSDNTEIERKFLVSNTDFLTTENATRHIVQGYLCNEAEKIVRVRADEKSGFITIKGTTKGITRKEYEYPIPKSDAEELMSFCAEKIEKTRHLITYEGHTFEVDFFEGKNKGLIMAELELTSEDEKFAKPSWLGKEVSDDPRYYNANLIKKPFTTW
ncbi:hypothetical protein EIN_498310 [Entamoeba invadens IP1]|uniref:CYTH domain-containing protein n=1 Tax=Entamoeba invadens IP1 TaxID=370355 RepID=A0A0A1UDJ7_ENTIV|nr:hypothetical protein EIN_498310 [Entamoeba invadens IP1]ELP94631.1 hypothetical protein EIN_498310 [Entamoeba invadens IP1]|eukprot:XP_004261402.1 hypothetical protein EIN_498310 [Entamoeba invadens IP1]